MVTNINLVSPESNNKSMLTGKTTLTLSVLLVILSLIAYGVIFYFEKNYTSKAASQESEIQAEKAKMGGPNYAALADFQQRVDVLGKAIDDHSIYENYISEFSKFVVPEMKLTDFSMDNEDSLSIKGETTNYDALSKGIILLQKFPGIASIEFKSAGEKSATDESQSGLAFELTAKINKSALKSNFAKAGVSQ